MSSAILHPKVIDSLATNHIAFEAVECNPDLADTAAFCAHYGFKLEESANTIIVASKKIEPAKYAACLVLANTRLDVNKKVTSLLEVKKASFADGEVTKKLTDMMIGGVTIFGIEQLPIFVDSAVMEQERIIVGGGNRSSKVIVNPKELLKLKNVQIVQELAKVIA